MSIGEVSEALTALRDAYATFAACDKPAAVPPSVPPANSAPPQDASNNNVTFSA